MNTPLESNLIDEIYAEIEDVNPTVLGLLARLNTAGYLAPGELGKYLDEHGDYTRDDIRTFLWMILVAEGYEK